MEFANQSDLWKLLSGPGGPFSRQFAELDETKKEQVRSEVIGTLAPYLQNDGRYQIPHAFRLLWGQHLTKARFEVASAAESRNRKSINLRERRSGEPPLHRRTNLRGAESRTEGV
jgi:hypothetical protein